MKKARDARAFARKSRVASQVAKATLRSNQINASLADAMYQLELAKGFRDPQRSIAIPSLETKVAHLILSRDAAADGLHQVEGALDATERLDEVKKQVSDLHPKLGLAQLGRAALIAAKEMGKATSDLSSANETAVKALDAYQAAAKDLAYLHAMNVAQAKADVKATGKSVMKVGEQLARAKAQLSRLLGLAANHTNRTAEAKMHYNGTNATVGIEDDESYGAAVLDDPEQLGEETKRLQEKVAQVEEELQDREMLLTEADEWAETATLDEKNDERLRFTGELDANSLAKNITFDVHNSSKNGWAALPNKEDFVFGGNMSEMIAAQAELMEAQDKYDDTKLANTSTDSVLSTLKKARVKLAKAYQVTPKGDDPDFDTDDLVEDVAESYDEKYCHHELKRNVARLHRAHKAILTAEAILSDLLATNNNDDGSKSGSESGSESGSKSGSGSGSGSGSKSGSKPGSAVVKTAATAAAAPPPLEKVPPPPSPPPSPPPPPLRLDLFTRKTTRTISPSTPL